MSGDLIEASRTHRDDSLPQHTLRALAQATLTRLQPDNWNDPYTAFVSAAAGAGLSRDQLVLLRRAAQVMDDSDDPLLRARVSDICWWYLDRSDEYLRDAAVTAYAAGPLDGLSWFRDGSDALQRAIEIIKRGGARGRPNARAIADRVRQRLLAATIDDGFFGVRLSQVARKERLVASASRLDVAALSTRLADGARQQRNRNLEQAWEEEATAWYLSAGRTEDAAAASTRHAMSLIAEAEERRSGVGGTAITASTFVERALHVLTRLPRAYRAEYNLDHRIKELRAQLADDRMAILEGMATISSGPVDISEQVAYARSKVSGLDPLDALVALGSIHRIASYDKALAQARQSINDQPLSHLFGNEHYSSTGQKLFSSPGSGRGTAQVAEDGVDATTWGAMIRDHNLVIGLIVSALIAPALEAINLQHRYTMYELYELCRKNPYLPDGHEAAWAQGLLSGLNGDFFSAVSVLVPQIEHLARAHLKANQVHTLVTDERGVETEKGFGALLDEPMSSHVFGSDLVFEMKALLTDRQGPNLRNIIAHGLVGDVALIDRTTVYAWWFGLHLAVMPMAAERHQAGTNALDNDGREAVDDPG